MPRLCKPEGLCQRRECQNDYEKKTKRPGSSHAGTPKHREQDQTTGTLCLCNAKTIIVVAPAQQAVAPAIMQHITQPALSPCASGDAFLRWFLWPFLPIGS